MKYNGILLLKYNKAKPMMPSDANYYEMFCKYRVQIVGGNNRKKLVKD